MFKCVKCQYLMAPRCPILMNLNAFVSYLGPVNAQKWLNLDKKKEAETSVFFKKVF